MSTNLVEAIREARSAMETPWQDLRDRAMSKQLRIFVRFHGDNTSHPLGNPQYPAEFTATELGWVIVQLYANYAGQLASIEVQPANGHDTASDHTIP